MGKRNLRLRRIFPLLLLGSIAGFASASASENPAPWRPVVMEVEMIILQAQSGKRILPADPKFTTVNKQPGEAKRLPERYAANVSRIDDRPAPDFDRPQSRVDARSYRLHF